jgi:hypothetical protein
MQEKVQEWEQALLIKDFGWYFDRVHMVLWLQDSKVARIEVTLSIFTVDYLGAQNE